MRLTVGLHDADMTTTPQAHRTHVHTNSRLGDGRYKSFLAIVAISLSLAAVGTLVTNESQFPSAAGRVAAESEAQTSALVDGRDFEDAISHELQEFNRSALLDEAAFRDALNRAVDQASRTTSTQTAFLNGPGFNTAVADAVNRATRNE